MTFAAQLRAASGNLTAAQIAKATGASKRTIENWRCGRNAPNAREHRALLARITRARKRADK